MRALSLLFLAAIFSLMSCDQPVADSSERLFNGRDLAGWQKQPELGIHGAGGNWGVTEDGVLFGEQDPPGSGEGGLLLTKEKYGEFELVISMKPDWGPCSGIFLRTNEKGEGWQIYVDNHDNGNVGHVRLETKPYSVPFRPFKFSRIEEGKPGLKTEIDERTEKWPEGVYEFLCSAETFLRVWKPDDWNQMRVRCTGKTELPEVEIWINGERICKFNAEKTNHPGFDREQAKSVVGATGHIGLQVHRGNGWPKGARVFWKDIRVTRLGIE